VRPGIVGDVLRARRLPGAVGHEVAADLAPGRLDRHVRLAGRHPEALGDQLEVVDERLHRGVDLVAGRQRHLAIAGVHRTAGQVCHGLLDDAQRDELKLCLESLRNRLPRLVSRIATEFRDGALPPEWTKVPPAPSDVIETSVSPVTIDDLMERARGEGEPRDEKIKGAVKMAEAYFKPQGSFSPEERASALAELSTLVNILEASTRDSTDRDFGWSIAAALARQLAEHHRNDLDSESHALVRRVLLQAARERQPEPSEEMDQQFERWQSWGSPNARIEAVFGLFKLMSPDDSEILERIDHLSRDSRADVRYNVITHAALLPNDKAWVIADRAAFDSNFGVQTGLVAFALPNLWRSDEDRAAKMILDLYASSLNRDPEESREFRAQALNFIEFLGIYKQDPRAVDILERLLFKPKDEHGTTTLIFLMARRLEALLQQDPYDELFARRIVDYFQRGLQLATERSLKRVYDPSFSGDTEVRVDGKLVYELAARLYFASGAYERTSGGPRIEANPRFYALVFPLLHELAFWPIASVLHHLVQILDRYLVMDPRGVFLSFADAIKTGAKLNFQFDALAFNPIADFVERCLAEYHELLESDADLRGALVDVMNILAEAGHPRFQQVISSLESLYR